MYEQLRNELMSRLAVKFPSNDIQIFVGVLDRIMLDYDLKRKETAIQLYDASIYDAAKVYLLCRKAAGLKDGSLENIKYTLKRFADSIGKPLTEITTNDIRGYLYCYQQRTNISPATLEKMRERLNGYFKWCQEEGIIKINPVSRVDKIKTPRPERRALTAEELEYCRNQCVTIREKALFEVLYSTGARVAEISNANVNDIDWIHGSIRVFGKNSEYYTVYLNAKAKVSLKRYLNSRTDNSPALFITERKPVRRLSTSAIRLNVERIGSRAGIEVVVSPHVMRHTMATMAFQHGTSLEIVQHLLNHKSPATTQIYAEMDTSEVAAAHKRTVI